MRKDWDVNRFIEFEIILVCWIYTCEMELQINYIEKEEFSSSYLLLIRIDWKLLLIKNFLWNTDEVDHLLVKKDFMTKIRDLGKRILSSDLLESRQKGRLTSQWNLAFLESLFNIIENMWRINDCLTEIRGGHQNLFICWVCWNLIKWWCF